MACYLIDIDGTIADNQHRQWVLEDNKFKPDWELFFSKMGDDKPIPHMRELTKLLLNTYQETGEAQNYLIYVTGRPERFRAMTEGWLATHRFPKGDWMYMRPDGDHRPDHIVKLELLEQIRKDGFNPTMAFDDRDQVVRMWRMNGVPCAQVAEGDF